MRYELLRRIGIGGMAEVFKARAHGEEGFTKELVLKRILPHLSANEEFQARFVDEAKLSVQLQHANIVQVLDLGRIGTQLFIAMELVEGADVGRVLKQLRKTEKPLPIQQALYIAGEVLKGLQYAHESTNADGQPLELVHRDVSPANILVSLTGAVKLCDFGIAKAAERTAHTREGVAVGKVAYMAPEQVQSRPVDGRTDLYSVGVVLSTMLAGKHPFEGETDMGMIHRIVSGSLPLPSVENKGVPKALDKMVAKATATKAEDRYQDAGEFLDALEEFAVKEKMRLSARSLAKWLKEIDIQPPLGEVVDASSMPSARPLPQRAPTAATHASSDGVPSPAASLAGSEEAVDVEELSQEEKEELFDFAAANVSAPVESFLEIDTPQPLSLENVLPPAGAASALAGDNPAAAPGPPPAANQPLELADTGFMASADWDRRVLSVDKYGPGRTLVRLAIVGLLTAIFVGSAIILVYRG